MSWIKPNFLWMIFRSGWGTKEGQEYTLAISIPRTLFEEILLNAAWSSYKPERYQSYAAWENHKNQTDVRLQWDPDHNPLGDKLDRRAIQLGLKAKMLEKFNQNILSIYDLSPHVSKQKESVRSGDWSKLSIPIERVYRPHSPEAGLNILVENF